MFRFLVLTACLALCKGHTTVPFSGGHTVNGGIISAYDHGYADLGHIGGYASGYGHGLAGHGLVTNHGHIAGHGLVAGHGLATGHGIVSGHGLVSGHSRIAEHGFVTGHGHIGFGDGHSFGAGLGAGNGFGAGHGLVAGHAGHGIGHHILKRSPHFVAPLAHEAPVIVPHVSVEPVAVSHQQRVDLHTSHAVLPVLPIKPIVASYLYGSPLFYKSYGGRYGAAGYGHF